MRRPGAPAVRRGRGGAPWLLAAMLWHVLQVALAVACAMPVAPGRVDPGATPAVAAATRGPHEHGAHAHGAEEHGAREHGAAPDAGDDRRPAGGGHEAVSCAAAGTCVGVLVASTVVADAGAPTTYAPSAPRDGPQRAPTLAVQAPEPPPPKG